ncbi:hypothetical protein QQX98_005038 [Neonectria punicea]|uniref:ABC transporter n=1 Tax=Neonectria punicea TaxID=979145 RepID=A0ABR1H6G7_9HYPO
MTVLKGIVLVLEAQHKNLSQHWKDRHSPEETSGIFSLSTYSWLDRLFLSGFRSLLSIGDLYALDQTMSASCLQTKVNQREIKGPTAPPLQKLSWRMFTTLAAPLLLPVIPRLAVIGFTFCQPFVMETILAYLQSPSEQNYGYGLIGATVIVYTGMAISNALYFYWQERFTCMARGVLFTAVYDKTISLPATADSAVLTLMNSDIERIKMERKLGAAFAAPIVVVVLCIVASGGVATITGRRQVAWMKAIEERATATATTISAMKSLRISGMVGAVEKLIQGLREQELRIGGKWRLMLVVAVTLSFTPMTIGPLMAFAVTSQTLEVTRIFPAMAYMTLLAAPLVSLFQNIPGLMSALACLGRIDAYMGKESRVDPRTTPYRVSFAHEKAEDSKEVPALQVTGGQFGWTIGDPILRDINLTIPFSSLTIVVGPIASGKSTLLKALLGETTLSSGTIALGVKFQRIGYCDQIPFLLNDTIRANIVGHAQFDATRYQQVLHATSLAPDLKQLPQGDRTNIGGSGISLSGGQKQRVALARALYIEADLYLFDDILSGLDASTSRLVFQRTLGPQGLLARRNATVVLCTHDERYLHFADKVLAISEDGLLTAQGTVEELAISGHLQNGTKAVKYDGLLNQEKEEVLDCAPESEHSINTIGSTEARQQDGARQLGDFSVYRHYFASMANWVILLFALSCCCYGFTSNFPTVWLKYWSADVVRSNPTQSGAFYVGIYALLQTTCLLSLIAVVLLCTQSMISQTGSRLHQRALRTVISAPLRFFALVDAGTITNLFAQDLTLIDSELPLSLLNFALSLFSLVGMAAVIAIASPWLAVAYPFLIGVVYYIQLFYLRTSRQLRLLDLESKAPLYAHFINTLSGLVTLRALGHIDASVVISNSLLDTSQRPAYLLAMIQRWLQLVLRLIVMLLATIIVTLATQLRTDSGFTGATLLTLMTFGDMLATIVQSYTTLETSIGAVARLKTFGSSTEPESQPDVDVMLDDKWPQRGQIEIKDVSVSYSGEGSSDQGTIALRDLSITFNAGERVAIVGRTGSGKSSLILLLLRLLDPLPTNEPSSGITIDGLPLEKIHRDVLRRRIIAVSQDSIFLPSCSGSTLRSNLDPFREASDHDLLDTLKAHSLDFLINEQERSEQSQNILDCSFSPDSLSQGQKQLFNLARAVVRRRVRNQAGAKGGILLLDEVSSSVDSHTDEKMWEIIQDEFAGYTVIMIAHRLDLAMKCDRVVVMDEGRVAETGQPDDLQCQKGGLFKALLEAIESRKAEK